MKNSMEPYKKNINNEVYLNGEEVDSFIHKSLESLKVKCEKCFGLCCVALYFSASEGFPTDKEAGKPCINLQSDFRCTVHKDLRNRGLKGCTAYDCFGAGQKVAEITYNGHSWQSSPDLAKEMFEVFLVMRQLQEMLWYLTEALRLNSASHIKEQLISAIKDTEELTLLNSKDLMSLGIIEHRNKINFLLHQASESIRSKMLKGSKIPSLGKKTTAGRADFIGKDLRKANLKCADFRGALLIAADLRGVDLSGANFIGADLRDTDLRGANLTKSLFLTQAQINTAKGDFNTRLPISLSSPSYWEK